jgi:hypothetical protein
VACTLCAFAAGPKIEFTETTYDFGTIKEENGAVTHVFEFKNTGDEKLVIISAIASCGCTTPKYPTEPIAPGATGKIKVTYNPSGRPGEFEKGVKVRYNAGDKGKQRVVIKITGNVVPKASN